jgi:hypothetical protein
MINNLLTDTVKKQVLKDQLLYNLNSFPLSLQERTAIKKAVKELELSIKRMNNNKEDEKNVR